jgi:peptidoglycan-N-acetylglucosamine deacetylase
MRNNFCRFVLLCVLSGMLFINSLTLYAYAGEVIKSHKNVSKKIALTFDDGPHPVYTKRILDILAKYDVSATFFTIGKNASLNSELICRIINEGHEIGNHTWNHQLTWLLGRDALIYELSKTERVICEISDFRPKLFRPPDGRNSITISQVAREMDYSVILWTIDTRDWETKTKVGEIVTNITSNIHSGSIILCHDYVNRTDSVTPDAIATVIPLLLERGYRFVTVSELIYSS